MRFIPATLKGKRLRPGGAGTVTKGSAALAWLWRRQRANGDGLKLIPVHDVGADIVTLARRDLGKHESPQGSNWGAFVEPVLRACGWSTPAPWCCAWATYIVRHVPGTLAILLTAGCGSLRAWAVARGRWTATPKVGYIGIVAPDEHAVIVTHVTGGMVATIAGNTSRKDGANYNGGEVAEHVYSRSVFSGFVRTY